LYKQFIFAGNALQRPNEEGGGVMTETELIRERFFSSGN